MKVLYIAHHLRRNDGWSRLSSDLISEMNTLGVETLCLVNEIEQDCPISQKKVLSRNQIFNIISPLGTVLDAFRVNKIIREYKPDLIHILVEPYGTMVPFLKSRGIPIIFNVYGTYTYMPALFDGLKKQYLIFMTRLLFKKVDMIISISTYTENYLKTKAQQIGMLKYIENKLAIISGGVEARLITNDLPVVKNDKKVSEILFVGAIKPRKGLMEAIRTVALLKSDFIYRVVGSYDEKDPYVIDLKNEIKTLGLESKVIFCGRVSDKELSGLYQSADLFLMLSKNDGVNFEGFGLVYLEANAKGVPVVGPNDSGVLDSIVDGKTGYNVSIQDYKHTAEVIDNLLQHKTIKREDCIEWARANTNNKKAQQVLSLYKNRLSVK